MPNETGNARELRSSPFRGLGAAEENSASLPSRKYRGRSNYLLCHSFTPAEVEHMPEEAVVDSKAQTICSGISRKYAADLRIKMPYL